MEAPSSSFEERMDRFTIMMLGWMSGLGILLVLMIIVAPGVVRDLIHSFRRDFPLYELAPFYIGLLGQKWFGGNQAKDTRSATAAPKTFLTGAPLRLQVLSAGVTTISVVSLAASLWAVFTIIANLRLNESMFSHGAVGCILTAVISGLLFRLWSVSVIQERREFLNPCPPRHSAGGA